MRLNQLDLIRYGRFQDMSLTLPAPAPGTPDVTLIFGPNEAGKSTAFDGFLELLFGMRGGAHPYAFRFDRADLLLGAELDIPGRGALTLRRNSKRTRTLLDDQNRPVDETLLHSALHGLGRDAFVERFSLNDTSLRSGGDRIARAEGDLGQLLHAGVSGLTGLADVLGVLESSADGFHRKGARNSLLRQGKARLGDIARDLRANTLTAKAEADLMAARDAARARFDAADADLICARAGQAAAQAALIWYEQSQNMSALDDQLRALPDGPDLAPGAPTLIGARVATLAERAEQISRDTTQRKMLEDQQAELGDDPVSDALEPELDRFDALELNGAPLNDRATTAEADLKRRCTERDELQTRHDRLLQDLAVAPKDAQALVLPDQDLDHLARAIEHERLAETQATQAQDEATRAREALGQAPQAPRDLSALKTAFEHWKGVANTSGPAEALHSADARLTRAQLHLPKSWPALLEAGLPEEEVLRSAVQAHVTLTAERAQARAATEKRCADLDEARAICAAQDTDAGTIDAAGIEETRRLRDAAWQAHLAQLDRASAQEFETLMRSDDTARAHFFAGATARDQLRAAITARARAQAQLNSAREHDQTLSQRLDHSAAQIDRLARSLGLPDGTDAAALAPRLARLAQLAEVAAEARLAQAAHDGAMEQESAARGQLEHIALRHDVPWDNQHFEQAVTFALATQDQVADTWARWQKARAQCENLDLAARHAAQQLDAAQAQRQSLAAHLPLPDTSCAGLTGAISDLRAFQAAQSDLAKLSRRVSDLETALASVAASARQLVRLGAEDGPTPLATVDGARRRVRAAREAARKRQELSGRIADLTAAIETGTQARDKAQSELDAQFKGQGAADLAPSDRVALLVRRDGLRRDRAAADQSRSEARQAVDRTQFDEELSLLPNATRPAELVQRVTDAQNTRDAALAEATEAERHYKDALAADLRADLVTEEAALLEEIGTGALAALKARLGALAARGALRRLAGERRSSMVTDVERAFVAMTAPKWKGVEVWTETAGDKLVGIGRDGAPVAAQNMSTGTMGQLYFALRLAGYLSFARETGPLPMILDDIMETFDDARARAALTLCGEIGTVGQTIMFTHHEHLVALARETLPGVSVIELPR